MSRIVRQTKNAELMAAGVTIEDPATTYIDADVEVGADTIIHPGVSLEGAARRSAAAARSTAASRIVELAHRRPRDRAQPLRDHRLARSTTTRRSGRSRTCATTRRSARGAKVGNFVELKKTALGAGLEVDAPDLSGRRDDRRERQHRRRHDHLQLRRRAASTRRRSRTARSSAATRSSSRRSRSARAPTSAPARRSARTCPPARSRSAPASSGTSRAGSKRRNDGK